MKIKIGSRESRLAVIQSELLIDCIKRHHPEIETELITMKTTGDIILDKSLDKIGGKGLFTKELDAALINGRIDLAVHSLKDLPVLENLCLPILAYSKREDARDVLVLPQGSADIDFSKPIGSSSKRRQKQLSLLYPKALFAPVRGNVETRLKKLDSGEFSALVLAAAGLKRLGLSHRINRYFSPEEMLPAACQGILCVQGRALEDTYYLAEFDDFAARTCAMAERAFIRRLEGGCSSPAAAYAVLEESVLHLRGMDEFGRFAERGGSALEANALGDALAERLLKGRNGDGR